MQQLQAIVAAINFYKKSQHPLKKNLNEIQFFNSLEKASAFVDMNYRQV